MRGLIERALAYIADHAWERYCPSADRVGISDRTSSNKYTVPYDGVIRLEGNYRSGSYIMLYVDGVIMGEACSAGTGSNCVQVVPVFKGQKVYCNRSNNYCYADFYAYKNYGGGRPDLTPRYLHGLEVAV